MDITPLINPKSKIVQAVSGNAVTISSQRYEESLIVTPDQVVAFSQNDFDKLVKEDFEVFEGKHIDVLIVGTGAKQKFFAKDIKNYLGTLSIVSETMSNAAAARTYNVLLTEGRRVAALFFVD